MLLSWNVTINVRHYNNKQHHSPTRGGETMACVLVAVDKSGWGCRNGIVCAWFKKKITVENWKNKGISMYILGMLGPLVE